MLITVEVDLHVPPYSPEIRPEEFEQAGIRLIQDKGKVFYEGPEDAMREFFDLDPNVRKFSKQDAMDHVADMNRKLQQCCNHHPRGIEQQRQMGQDIDYSLRERCIDIGWSLGMGDISGLLK